MDPLELLKAKLAGQSIRSLARKMHVTNVYLGQVLRGKLPPGPKILRYLGLERVKSVTYRQKPPRQKNYRVRPFPPRKPRP